MWLLPAEIILVNLMFCTPYSDAQNMKAAQAAHDLIHTFDVLVVGKGGNHCKTSSRMIVNRRMLHLFYIVEVEQERCSSLKPVLRDHMQREGILP